MGRIVWVLVLVEFGFFMSSVVWEVRVVLGWLLVGFLRCVGFWVYGSVLFFGWLDVWFVGG